MAPKKEDTGPAVDTNPFGAFINVSVSYADIVLELPTEPPAAPAKAAKGAPAAPAGPPKLHVTLTHLPAKYAPVISPPVEISPNGTYQFAFEGRARREPSLESMHELINSPALLSICDSTTNAILASATLDLLEFGLGATSLAPGSVSMKSESGAKVTAATLHDVRLWLTHRPNPSPDAQAAEQPAGKAPPPAQQYPAEADLPAPVEYSFLAPELQQGANVVELTVQGITGLPPSLPAVIATATEGKAGGKVTFTAALKLPQGLAVTLGWGALQTNGDGPSVAFQPISCRQLMTAAQAQALTEALEDDQPIMLEVARYLASDTMSDLAWDAYHAEADVPGLQALLKPGATSSADPSGPVPLKPFTASTSILPAYTAPQGKNIKVMEEAPAGGTCAWLAAGSSVSGCLVRLARPLVPPWQPPPPPPRPLLELVPARPALQPHTPPVQADDRFKVDSQAMVKALVHIQTHLDHAAGAVSVQQLRQALAQDGRLQQLKDAIKTHAVQVAMSKFHKGLDGGHLESDQAANLLSQLHAHMSHVVNTISGASSDSADQTGLSQKLQTLQHSADECEQVDAWGRAADLHQQRVLLAAEGSLPSLEASAWHAYGDFCLRRGQEHQGRAEQALRRALRLDPQHKDALASLCTLLLHQGLATDSLYLSEAARLSHTLLDVSQQQSDAAKKALAFGLLFLVCSAQGDKAESHNVARALAGLQEAETVDVQGHESNGLLAVAELASRLALPFVAVEAVQTSHQELPNSSTGAPAVSTRLALAHAQALACLHQAAASAAKTADDDSTAAQTHLQAVLTKAATQVEQLPEPEANQEGQLVPGLTLSDAAPTEELVQQAKEASTHAARRAQAAADYEQEVFNNALELCSSAKQQASSQVSIAADLLTGRLWHRAGNWKECVGTYAGLVTAAASSLQPLPLSAYMQLAQSYTALGQPQQAKHVFMQACAQCPCATTWLGLATSCAGGEDTIEQQAALAQALACDPQSAPAWAHLALLAFKIGQDEEAVAHVNSALQMGLENLELLLQLAGTCSQHDKHSQARACLEKALQQPGSSPQVQLALAEVCLDEEDVMAARRHLEALVASSAVAAQPDLMHTVNDLVPRLLDLQMRGV